MNHLSLCVHVRYVEVPTAILYSETIVIPALHDAVGSRRAVLIALSSDHDRPYSCIVRRDGPLGIMTRRHNLWAVQAPESVA